MNVRVPKAGLIPGPVLWMMAVKKGTLEPLTLMGKSWKTHPEIFLKLFFTEIIFLNIFFH